MWSSNSHLQYWCWVSSWHVPKEPFEDAGEGFDVDVDFADEDADGEVEFVSPALETNWWLQVRGRCMSLRCWMPKWGRDQELKWSKKGSHAPEDQRSQGHYHCMLWVNWQVRYLPVHQSGFCPHTIVCRRGRTLHHLSGWWGGGRWFCVRSGSSQAWGSRGHWLWQGHRSLGMVRQE